jgi:glycosyltransferase involved in cell wall biosynthesis
MKLFIQIPCYNEEATLSETLADIPETIEGISSIDVLVINDGSTDKTIEVARANGVKHIIDFKYNRGLSHTFAAGMRYCYEHGADIVVNTDADNQYCGADIPLLVAPILNGNAQMVIGDRHTHSLQHFSPLKKFLQKAGSRVASYFAGVKVSDAASGFRAFSRDLAGRIFLFTQFSYTMETIIMCGQRKIPITSVPIRTNAPTRPSRLFKSMPHYLFNSTVTIIRVYLLYASATLLTNAALIFIVLGTIPGIRFLILALMSMSLPTGKLQSLLLGAVFIIIGGLLLISGLIVHNIQDNRKLIEALYIQTNRTKARNE